jgi:hypothetical protein
VRVDFLGTAIWKFLQLADIVGHVGGDHFKGIDIAKARQLDIPTTEVKPVWRGELTSGLRTDKTIRIFLGPG